MSVFTVKTHKSAYVVGTLSGLNRLKSSPMGNPRYEVEVETLEGTILRGKTPVDSMLAYGIGNFFGKVVQVSYHITPKGRVVIDNCNKL